MQFGVAYPTTEVAGDPDAIRKFIKAAEPRRQIPIWLGGHTEPGHVRGAQFGDGFIFAAPGAGAVEAWQRVKYHLGVFGRDEKSYGRALLTLFARNLQETAGSLQII